MVFPEFFPHMANRILSYVAALAEVCIRDEINPPNYDVIKVEGPCHDPIFVIKGRAGKYEVEGRGSKKQTAKQHAAKQILVLMGELSEEDLRLVENNTGYESAKVIGNVVDDGFSNTFRTGTIPIEDSKEKKRNLSTPVPIASQINPLGDLIEIAGVMGWPNPRVMEEQKTGPPHDPRFTVSCYFSKFKTFATSRSKKEAKRLAAIEMHENMRYQPDIMYKYSFRTGRTLEISSVCNNDFEVSDPTKFAASVDFTYAGVPKILHIAESHTIEMLKQIKSAQEIANPESVLQNIIKECMFQVDFEILCEDLQLRSIGTQLPDERSEESKTFLKMKYCPFSSTTCDDDFECESSDKEFQSQLKDSISSQEFYSVYATLKLPIRIPIRLIGYGPTIEIARFSASINALEYLRLMSLKDTL